MMRAELEKRFLTQTKKRLNTLSRILSKLELPGSNVVWTSEFKDDLTGANFYASNLIDIIERIGDAKDQKKRKNRDKNKSTGHNASGHDLWY